MRYLKDKARFQVAFKTQITVRHFPLKKKIPNLTSLKWNTLSLNPTLSQTVVARMDTPKVGECHLYSKYMIEVLKL